MKIFVDTNVLVSAFSSTRFCSELITRILESHDLIISTAVSDELERILRDKFRIPEELIQETLQFLKTRATVIENFSSHEISIRDMDDIGILSAALSAKVEFFVTGDREILSLERIGEMRIMSPREFSDFID